MKPQKTYKSWDQRKIYGIMQSGSTTPYKINMLLNATSENLLVDQNARSQASKILRLSKKLTEKKLT